MRKKIFLILIFLSIFVSFFIFRHYFSIFYFQNDLNKIAINIEMETNEDMFVCFNKNCDKMTFKNGIYSYKLNQENPIFYNDITDNLEIITFKNKNIKSINVFIAADFYYFKNNDLNFREIEFNNQKAYSINLNVPSNNKSFFQKIALYFEGIFYNWYFYLISYILIILYLIF